MVKHWPAQLLPTAWDIPDGAPVPDTDLGCCYSGPASFPAVLCDPEEVAPALGLQVPSLQWEPRAILGGSRRMSHEEKHRGERSLVGASPPPAWYILSATPLPKLCPQPEAPFTPLSAAPVPPGFQPPPGSLLRFPPPQPVRTLSSFGPPQASSTVNSFGCGQGVCGQTLMKSQMTKGGDWGTPALSQHSSVTLHPSPKPKPLPTLHPCPPPWRCPSRSIPLLCPLHGVSWLCLKGSG